MLFLIILLELPLARLLASGQSTRFALTLQPIKCHGLQLLLRRIPHLDRRRHRYRVPLPDLSRFSWWRFGCLLLGHCRNPCITTQLLHQLRCHIAIPLLNQLLNQQMLALLVQILHLKQQFDLILRLPTHSVPLFA